MCALYDFNMKNVPFQNSPVLGLCHDDSTPVQGNGGGTVFNHIVV
jgi:hypothetical protein